MTEALLPPAGLAVLALLLLLAGRRRGAAAGLLALLLLSIGAAPHAMVAPLLLPPGPAPAHPPGAIVVFASELQSRLVADGPGPDTLLRLRTAAALARRTALPVLLGGAWATDMAASLTADFGVPSTWVEPRPANLWQGARAAAALLRPAGIDTVYMVAQPWEMRLGTAVFAAAGLTVVPAPVAHAEQRPLAADSLLPLSPVWLDSAVIVRQWAGLACQAMPPCIAAMRGGR